MADDKKKAKIEASIKANKERMKKTAASNPPAQDFEARIRRLEAIVELQK